MLIDKTEVRNHREISRGVRDEKINPFIEDAENLDLKPLLGDKLYFALIAAPTDARFVDLLDPKTYTYNDNTYQHQGLKKVLSIFSFARYQIHGSFTDTGFGFVSKKTQDSEPVSETQKRNLYTKERQTAVAYFNEVALFLSRNSDIYPEWNSGSVSRALGSIRITKIS